MRAQSKHAVSLPDTLDSEIIDAQLPALAKTVLVKPGGTPWKDASVNQHGNRLVRMYEHNADDAPLTLRKLLTVVPCVRVARQIQR